MIRPKPEVAVLETVAHVVEAGIGAGEAVDASERTQPVAGLGERDADVPASALVRAAGERRHRGKGHEIAGAVIERLRRQRLRRFGAGGLRLGDIEAVDVLHQRIEAAPARPRPFVAVGAERDVDDAGPDARGLLRAEAVGGNRAGPVALHEDVGVAQQAGERRAAVGVAQVDGGRRACRGRCR